MGAFWLTCPNASIWVISKYRDLGILRFWSSMGFGRLEAIASLYSYQITNYPFLSKTHHFLLPDFRRIREISFWTRSFMANCLSRRDQNVYSIFQNRAPRGTKGFQKTPKWKKVFIKMDWLLTMITNHFEIPVVQNLKTFSFFLHWLYDHEIYSLFFFNIGKIQNDKDVWN